MIDADNSRDIRPIPDPTVLTTAASVRLEEMIRNLITTENKHMMDLFTAKLATIESRFQMLEARTAEQKKDTKDALDAALAAQKEAVAAQTASSEKSITKSETATIERIKAVETLLSASSHATDDKIDDLKVRVVAIEAVKLGTSEGTAAAHESGVDSRAVIASVIQVGLAIVAVGSLLFAILKP